MAKKLRVCLAMGGGVSLGSFSGSALTESLKLLILFGKDKKGTSYDEIIVDGMSGASAGAIALTILLRSLMDYTSMIDIFNSFKRDGDDDITEDSLIKDLCKAYRIDDFTTLPEKKRSALLALEVAQRIQHQIWVRRLNARELFGEKLDFSKKPNIHGSFGLLDRNLLKRLASDYLLTVDRINKGNIQVLDKDRVPFACSLTNLLPIEVNGQNDEQLTILQENVLKSTGSSNHAELRLIDFKFNKEVEKKSDERWLQFYENASDSNMELDLYNNKAWSVLVASALACGAFPIAFEPVILKRYQQEYADDEWPAPFESIKAEMEKERKKVSGLESIYHKSFFNEEKDAYIDYNSFNFPYIDGGTFNNEPIREAFRIASFQDFQRKEGEADRLILFVDPAVRQEKHRSFNIGSFMPVATDQEESNLKGEVGKLFGSVTGIIGLLQHQGSIKEEHRIKDIRENLNLRNELFNFVNSNDTIHERLTYDLVRTVFIKIKNNLNTGIIPVGTREVDIYFKNELDKTCAQGSDLADCIVVDPQLLKAIADSLTSENPTAFPDMKSITDKLNEGIDDDVEKNRRILLFAKTVFKMMADFSLNTVGKNEKAEVMSILPIAMDSLQTIELPGDELAAFSGFASEYSREYTFDYGKLSALLSLSEDEQGFRDNGGVIVDAGPDTVQMKNNFRDQLLSKPFYNAEYKFADEINRELLSYSVKRIVQLVFSLFKTELKWSKFFKGFLSSIKTMGLGLLGFFGGLVGGLKQFKLLRFGLIKFLNGKAKKTSEEINYKKLLPITISIISKKKRTVKIKVIAKHGTRKIKMVRHELKDEKGDFKYYQYLFALHYLEYEAEADKDVTIDARQMFKMKRRDSLTVNKTSSDTVGTVGLTFEKKVSNPSIDNNIFRDEWRKALEAESDKIEIQSLKWKGRDVGNLIEDINNRNYSLYYSLKNLNYHINPMLEYNFDEPTSWYFKENTKAFYLDLIDEQG